LIIITLWYKNQHKKKHLEKLFLVFFLLLNPFIILAENNKWIFTGIKYFAGSSVGIDGKEYTLDPISLISIDTSCYITNTVVDTACGEYLFNANFIDASGSYIDTISSVGGCDTIVTLQLTIFEDSSFTFITACDSAEWNGVWYFNDTIVTDTGFVTTNSFGGSTVTSNGKEGNVWYFGYNAGLDFNSGSPIALTDGQLYTLEGCASISDNNGDLLFYTDGMTVYDRNHIIMSNGTGLLGNNSSSQSGIIVKKPGSVSIYYIFTSDGVSGASGGVAYSEIDMSLNNGFGDVTSIKNVVLFPNACEKITGILHQNGTDFWIVSRLENSNTYHSYLVTNSGINLTPIVTNIGPVYSDLIGYLKSSSNCAMITAANWSTGLVDLFDFDNSTGIISNYVSLNIPGYAYGVEFSENSELLYVSDFTGGNIYQYNLLAGNQNDINNSSISRTMAASTALLFDLGKEEVFGVQLSQVSRLEEIKIEDLEFSGEQEVLQYRGGILPVVRLSRHMDVKEGFSDTDRLTLIVFGLYGREAGLLVRNIIDAHPLQGDLDTTVIEDPFLLGTMNFNDQVILMLDGMLIFDRAFPQWAKGRQMALSSQGGEAQVLFVDDSPFYRKVVKKYLSDAGLKVDLANDGLEGLEKIKEKNYDLVVVDFEMPNMDGLEMVNEVRKVEGREDLPILVLTSLTGGKDRENLMNSGIQSYLVKLNKEELLSETHRLLELNLATV